MDKGHHVKIVTPEFAADGTQAFIDGVKVARLVNVEFKHYVGSAATVLVEFYPESVDVEAQAEIQCMEKADWQSNASLKIRWYKRWMTKLRTWLWYKRQGTRL